MSEKKEVDVLIVGAGPVGLFCANELIRHGLSCRIIDQKDSLSEQSKALGIHIRTLDILNDCGFFSAVEQRGHQVTAAVFKSKNKKLFEISFENIKSNYHFLIDLPQDQTEHILYESLQKKHLQVEWRTELTEVMQHTDKVRAILRNKKGTLEHVSCQWLIACDGGHSTVRQLLNVPFLGEEYKENWWLADVIMDWNNSEAQMFFYLSQEGPLACFPMGKQRYRIVMTAPKGEPKEPALEDIQQVFNRRSSDRALLSQPVWISKFYLHHRQIQNYRLKRVFFAGDAAHIHSPMGGQGLNTGLQDIYNLVWKLALVQKKLAHPALLETYHLERYPVGRKVLKETDLMTRMATLTKPWALSIRNKIMTYLMSIPVIRQKIASQLAELEISYKDSPIVKQIGRHSKFKAGDFIPNFMLKNKERSSTLQAVTQGILHHLFLFEGLTSKISKEVLLSIVKSVFERHSSVVKVHMVGLTKDFYSAAGDCWMDEQARIHQEFSIKFPTAILIRPDKYIGLVQSPITEDDLKNYLNEIFN